MQTTASHWEGFQRVIDTRDFFNARRDFLKTSRPEVVARRYLRNIEIMKANKSSVSRILSDFFLKDTYRMQAAKSILASKIYDGEPKYTR